MNNLQLLIEKYESPVLDAEQIAQVMKVRKRTVYEMFKDNSLPFNAKKPGKFIVASVVDIAKWLDDPNPALPK